MKSTRRQVILDQALDLIITEGLGALTMGKVANRMGFTEPAMYRHFKNKQELVIGLIRRLNVGFEGVFVRFDVNDPPEVFFPVYFAALLEYIQQVRGVTFQFLSESAYSRNLEVRQELLKLFQGQLGRFTSYMRGAAARGEVRPGIDPEVAAICFLGVVQALVTRSLLTSWETGIDAANQSVLDVFLKGVTG